LSVVCCQAEVFATVWSLVQWSPTDCGVSCVIKKPRGWGGHSPRWAAESERNTILLHCLSGRKDGLLITGSNAVSYSWCKGYIPRRVFALERTDFTIVAVDRDLDFLRKAADWAVDVCCRLSVKLFVRLQATPTEFLFLFPRHVWVTWSLNISFQIRISQLYFVPDSFDIIFL
jgi:hypothetical protein